MTDKERQEYIAYLKHIEENLDDPVIADVAIQILIESGVCPAIPKGALQ